MELPNLTYIKEISGGDESFEKAMIAILKEEFPIELEQLKNNFEAQNYEQVALDVPKIKHKISMLGLKKGFELASNFEKEIKESNVELYKKLLVILERINVYLSNN